MKESSGNLTLETFKKHKQMRFLPANGPFGIRVTIYVRIPLEWLKIFKKTFILALKYSLNLSFSEKFDFLALFCEKLREREDNPNL